MGLKIPVVYLPLSVNTPVRLKHICAVLAAYRMVAVNKIEVVPIITDLVSAKWEKSWQRDLSWIGQAFDSPEKLGPFLFKEPFRQSERISIYQHSLSQMEPAPGYQFFLKKSNSFGTKLEPVSFKADTFFSDNSNLFVPVSDEDNTLLIGSTSSDGSEVDNQVVIWSNRTGPSEAFARYADYIHFSMTGIILPDSDLKNDFLCLENCFCRDLEPQIWCIPEIVTPAGDGLLDLSQDFFQAKGILPHALTAWLEDCWLNAGDTPKSVFSLQQLTELNSRFLRELDVKTVVRFVLPFLRQHQVDMGNRQQVFLLVDVLRFFFSDLSSLALEAKRLWCTGRFNFSKEVDAFVRRESSKIVLWSFLRQLGEYEHLQRANFPQIIQQVQLESGLIGKDLWRPIRLVLAGVEIEYDLAAIVEILGREKCGQRIRNVLGDYW